ncbi:MAG: hypothetical protein LUI08_05605, partial [Prevotella sp.]|nr:hypothetical protein [Prevotella sp.]
AKLCERQRFGVKKLKFRLVGGLLLRGRATVAKKKDYLSCYCNPCPALRPLYSALVVAFVSTTIRFMFLF